MSRKLFAGLLFAIGMGGSLAAEEIPQWVSRAQDVWVEEGIIYARGSSVSKMPLMALSAAENRARTNLSLAVAGKELTGYSPLPDAATDRSKFNINGVTGELGKISMANKYVGNDGEAFVLISCDGANIKIDNF